MSQESLAAKNIPSGAAADFLGKEYVALRAEILHRSGIQHQLVSLDLIALGTFLTYGLQGSANLLLLYPILTMFLAGAWSLNDYRIAQIGVYIKKRIEISFLEDGKGGWEHFGSPRRLHGIRGRLTIGVTRGIFVSTQIFTLGLASTITDFESIGDIILGGAALLVRHPR